MDAFAGMDAHDLTLGGILLLVMEMRAYVGVRLSDLRRRVSALEMRGSPKPPSLIPHALLIFVALGALSLSGCTAPTAAEKAEYKTELHDTISQAIKEGVAEGLKGAAAGAAVGSAGGPGGALAGAGTGLIGGLISGILHALLRKKRGEADPLADDSGAVPALKE